MDVAAVTLGVVNVGVAEIIVAVLKRFSYTHVLCYTEV